MGRPRLDRKRAEEEPGRRLEVLAESIVDGLGCVILVANSNELNRTELNYFLVKP